MKAPALHSLGKLLTRQDADGVPAAFDGNGIYTFGMFRARVAAIAAHVEAQGGQDWLIAQQDAWELAAALFALLHTGRRPVLPANHQDGHLAALAGQAAGVIGPELDLAGTAAQAALQPFDAARAELVLHTSGSSGKPEAFMKPFHCLEAEVGTLHETFAGTAPRKVLATVPAHHIYGLLFRVLWPLAAGWSFGRQMLRYPEDLPLYPVEQGNFHLVSSPAFLKRAADVLDWKAAGNLQGIFSSGGPLEPDVAALYNTRLPHPLYEVYGSTETGGIGYRAVKDAAHPAPWTPLAGVALSLDGNGRLAAASPHIPGGVFQTQDLASLYPDGRFMLKGRADRIVKIEERRVSLREIETRLKESGLIDGARCLPLEGTRLLLGVAAVPSEEGWQALRVQGKQGFVRGLRARLAAFMPPASLPRKWRFVSALPENAQGKTTEAALAALFEEAAGRKMSALLLEEQLAQNEACLRILPERSLAWFDGHFSVAPVLPGLAQLAWAVEAGCRLFAGPRPIARLEVVKFFEVIKPETEMTLTLIHEPEKNRLLFHYASAEGEHAKGRIVFGHVS